MYKLATIARIPKSFVRHQIRNSSHWRSIALAPPDAILGLNEAFKSDKSPVKVNLGVGAYRDDDGKPLVLNCVREAERRLTESKPDHEYAGIAGLKEYVDKSIEFAYGSNVDVIKQGRVAAIQTLSGTGACRVVGEFLARFIGKGKKIYMPDPTWGNHIPIMKNSGLEPAKYRYYSPDTNSVDFVAMLEDVNAAEPGSIFMLVSDVTI